MNAYAFALALIMLALIALLVYLAAQGSLAALITLAVIVTVVLIALGALIALLGQRLANEKAQQDFRDNAKENLAIMQSMQQVQNKQNQTLMQQLNQAARLPAPSPPGRPKNGQPLIIDDRIFDGLED